MQRRATKNTRAANAAEKHYVGWVKEQPCCFCARPAPAIFDHCEGSTFKHNKVLIGPMYGVGKCEECDQIKTLGNHNWHTKRLGKTHREAWLIQSLEYELETGRKIPKEIRLAIEDWRR